MKKIEGHDQFWNDPQIEMVKLGGSWFCLDGWNGALYTECFRYKDPRGLDRADDRPYRLRPVYDTLDADADQHEVVGYKEED